MDKEIQKMVDDEIRSQIENMSKLKAGSDEKIKAAECLTKLYKLRTEEERADGEMRIESGKADSDFVLKEHQLSEQKKDRWFKAVIAAAELGIPLIFYGVWMNKGFKFEETGTFTSQTFRNLFGRFKPTKK